MDNKNKKSGAGLNRKTKSILLNRAVQLAFFILAPGLYSSAFNGVKYLATQMGNTDVLEFTPFIAILITLLVYTVVFGRFFCGYACAFGFLGDVLYDASSAIQKKIRGHVVLLPAGALKAIMKVKYFVLAGILVLCFVGSYGKVSKFDPWEIFAFFRAGDFSLTGRTAGFIVLIAIMVGMCLVRRFFCLFLCPMGACFSFMPVLPWSSMGRKPAKCAGKCHQCELNCPTAYFNSYAPSDGTAKPSAASGSASPSESESSDRAETKADAKDRDVQVSPEVGIDGKIRNIGEGECIYCMRCVSGCPVHNAGAGRSMLKLSDINTQTAADLNGPEKAKAMAADRQGIRGNEWYLVLARAAILYLAIFLVQKYI